MPELPEVETTCRILRTLTPATQVEELICRRPDLRFAIPKVAQKGLSGARILAIERRAKYIIFATDRGGLLSHLGMTGFWRREDSAPVWRAHDHLAMRFEGGVHLVYNDARRFGFVDWLFPGRELSHTRLKNLGPEPLAVAESAACAWLSQVPIVSPEVLFERSRRRKVALKPWLMDQRTVVGVGNIYASEALFLAGLRPSRSAARLKANEADKLVVSIRGVLQRAIESGGSTIRTYQNANGEAGTFQVSLNVYDRAGEACKVCGQTIRSSVLGGRSTYWCRSCQK
jgi:formamidopyrimidine-DNA glycosylase